MRTCPTPRGWLPILALSLTACAPSDNPGGITVGFSQIGGESSWRSAETRSIREEAVARGITLKFSDAQGDQQKQIRALKNFIAQGVDAILLAPKVETGWEPVLREVQEAGIPVILVDRGVEVSDESLYRTLVASDFVAEGRMAGEWLIEASGGTAWVVELEGTPGSAPANDRKRGFAEAIAGAEGIEVLRAETALFERARGKEVMETLIKTDRDRITAVFAHNDDMALGAIGALEAAGCRPGEDVLVVSIDGMEEAFRAMVEGTLNATVECTPLLGPLAFDAVERILAGETVEKWTKVPDRIFTRDDAAEALPERKY
jgi:galactofuranose transport system substrate-binding protein